MDMFNLSAKSPQISQFSVEVELGEVSGEHGKVVFVHLPLTPRTAEAVLQKITFGCGIPLKAGLNMISVFQK